MVQTATMAKELVFKMRLDEDDRKRLDDIAAHMSAPAATVVRILIKREHDRLRLEGTGTPWVSSELYERAVDMYRRKMGEGGLQPNRTQSGFNDARHPDVLVLEHHSKRVLARLRYDRDDDKLIWLKSE